MNKLISFFKRIFNKKIALNESKILVEENLEQRDEFKNNIKANNIDTGILALQKQLESKVINESNLSTEEVIKLKKLYCNQIIRLVESIEEYKNKLRKQSN